MVIGKVGCLYEHHVNFVNDIIMPPIPLNVVTASFFKRGKKEQFCSVSHVFTFLKNSKTLHNRLLWKPFDNVPRCKIHLQKYSLTYLFLPLRYPNTPISLSMHLFYWTTKLCNYRITIYIIEMNLWALIKKLHIFIFLMNRSCEGKSKKICYISCSLMSQNLCYPPNRIFSK